MRGRGDNTDLAKELFVVDSVIHAASTYLMWLSRRRRIRTKKCLNSDPLMLTLGHLSGILE